ncbi:uncharacterized protein FMAN_14963 [Fusarium mangiferae]|uniref:Uncharacterized protein n=1 Tax=Fusarium mangiferae TaxID=192010 RepID=A0A1L7U0L1_FUSMA|nr:uncharacterized protein FMAN_14963 [Fusarium mangiferae]CVL03849.1 uncharacterized protein FMAN_14963 [Fusarium mangiferae]
MATSNEATLGLLPRALLGRPRSRRVSNRPKPLGIGESDGGGPVFVRGPWQGRMMGPRICQKSPCDSKNRKYLACFLDRQCRTSTWMKIRGGSRNVLLCKGSAGPLPVLNKAAGTPRMGFKQRAWSASRWAPWMTGRWLDPKPFVVQLHHPSLYPLQQGKRTVSDDGTREEPRCKGLWEEMKGERGFWRVRDWQLASVWDAVSLRLLHHRISRHTGECSTPQRERDAVLDLGIGGREPACLEVVKMSDGEEG